MVQRAGDTRTDSEYGAHLARIRQIITAWHAGELGTVAKRDRIAQENAQYYSDAARGATGTDVTRSPQVADEVLFALAAQLMVPVEAAGAALAAGRLAGWRAALAEDPEAARRELADAREAYREILRTAHG